MTKPSRNLWKVKMKHNPAVNLLILAATAELAVRKATTFTRCDVGLTRPVVIEVTFSGTIDVF